jgi:CheY-like chemotaxis protein
MSDTPANILVVDDDEFTGELTGLILESAGYGTVISIGGIDALEQMANDPTIRVVVSDMNMPVMDGIELFAELRKNGFSQPFVLLTGEEAAPLRIAHPDMQAILTKDEQLQEALPEIIESLLASS